MEIEAGRVATLRLSGDAGELDIFCIYLDTNSAKIDRPLFIKSVSALGPKNKPCLFSQGTSTSLKPQKTDGIWSQDVIRVLTI